MMQCNIKSLLPVMAAALVFHAVGVVYGSRNAVRINQVVLKKGIAVFSILIAIWKLSSHGYGHIPDKNLPTTRQEQIAPVFCVCAVPGRAASAGAL